jgi:hypothetical protein
LFSDASSEKPTAALIAEIWAAIRQLQTARTAEATTIGTGGVIVENGAGITLDGGGLLAIQGGSRVSVRYPSGGDAAYFGYIGNGTEIIAYGMLVNDQNGRNLFRVQDHATNGSQVIIGGLTPAASFQAYADDLDFRSKSVDIRGTGTVNIFAEGTDYAQILSLGGQAAIGGVTGTFIRPQSGSGTANVRMDTTTGQITWVSSTERVKTDIRDLDVDPAVVLQLRPRTWLPGAVPRQCPAWAHAQHAADECHAGELVDPPEDAPREVGFVAEELDVLGLGDFVEYDAEGLPISIRYDRVSAALVPLIQRQQQQIDDLAAKVEQLTARVAAQEHAPDPNTTRRQ